MNNQQQMFHDFYMSMVKEEQKEAAQELLQANFEKQDNGTFDREYLQSVMSRMYELIRPECIEQLKNAMENFAKQL